MNLIIAIKVFLFHPSIFDIRHSIFVIHNSNLKALTASKLRLSLSSQRPMTNHKALKERFYFTGAFLSLPNKIKKYYF